MEHQHVFVAKIKLGFITRKANISEYYTFKTDKFG